MDRPDQLDIALKEWAAVCGALAAGRQMILLRKGGIHESAGGFELEHQRFLLFPTFLHQNPEMLKQEAMQWYEKRAAEPEQITIDLAAEVTDIIQLKDRKQIDALAAEHIWTAPLIDMRFNYRPANPLYLLLVRAFKLVNAVTIANTPNYAGCKSWVPLDQAIDIKNASPVLDDSAFTQRREAILTAAKITSHA